MKPSDSDLESLLRQAPRPRPTPGLRRQLIDDIALPSPAATPTPVAGLVASWFRRWRFAVICGTVAVLCLGVLAVQQTQIQRLQDTIEVLRQQLNPAPASPAVGPQTAAPTRPADASAADPRAEIDQLRATVSRLAGEVSTLEALQSENARLKDQLVARSGATPEDVAAMAEARQRAQSIMCINNLKQLGLSLRIWATDNNDMFPPDILSMTNEMATPKVLVCPSDTSHLPATAWEEFGPANLSYEFLAANGTDNEPDRVAWRCPVHGHITLGDGSVQSSQAKTHPERFRMRDGKLYFGDPPSTNPGAGLNPQLMERYGLTPSTGHPPQPASAYAQFTSQGVDPGATPESEEPPQL